MTDIVPAAPASLAWRVTGQTERTIITDLGTPQDVIQVTFVLPDGTGGSVNIPRNAYTVEAVRNAIAAKASVLGDVAGLTG